MINTVFYYAENLPFEQYQLELGTKIAERTIVFAAALKAIYKDGVRYNSIDYDELKEKISQILIENSYVLPTASTTTKGGIKIGAGLKVTDDTLDVDFTKFGDIPEGLETIIANIIYQHIDELRGPQGPKGDKGDPGTGGESIDYSITSLGVNGKTITLNQNNNYRSPLSVDITTAVNNVINNSTVGGKTEVIVDDLVSAETKIKLADIKIDGVSNFIWMPVSGTGGGSGGSGGTTYVENPYDDSELRGKINSVEADLAAKWASLDNKMRTKFDDILNDKNWMDALKEGVQSESNFGEDDVDLYLQRIGIVTRDANGNPTSWAWSSITQEVDAIRTRVAAVEAEVGGDTTEFAAELQQYIDTVNGVKTAMNELSTTYARKSTEDILYWMYSGLVQGSNENKTWNDLESAASNGEYGAIANVSTQVRKLENGEYLATANLVSAIEGKKGDIATTLASAGVLTSADLNNASSTLYAKLDAKYAGIDAVVKKDSNGNIESSVGISADQIYLSGTTWADIINAEQLFTNYIQSGDGKFVGTFSSEGDRALYIETYSDAGTIYIGDEDATPSSKQDYFRVSSIGDHAYMYLSGDKSYSIDDIQNHSAHYIDISSDVTLDFEKLWIVLKDENRYIDIQTRDGVLTTPTIVLSGDSGMSTILAGSDYSYSSDIRFKNVLENLNTTVELIAEAPLFKYTITTDPSNKVMVGTSAQYWQNIIPEAVSEDSEGRLSLAYATVATASAITVAKEVVTLKEENTALRERVEALEARLQLIESKLNA